MKCPNTLVCQNDVEDGYFLEGRVPSCKQCSCKFHYQFAYEENATCPICETTTTCVYRTECCHLACISCFKGYHYYKDTNVLAPFPYSEEVEAEWDELRSYRSPEDQEEFLQKYPLVREWEYVILPKWREDCLNKPIENRRKYSCAECRKRKWIE